MRKSGRPYKTNEELTQLKYLVEKGDKSLIQSIVENYEVDAYDQGKRTALIWASFFGEVVLLNWLIEKGANVNFQDKTGYTGLHFCGQEKRYEVAKILLDQGADPNLKDDYGNSPLWTALFNAKGDFRTVKLLMAYGADPISKNKHGRSPDDMAMILYKKRIDELIE